MSVRKVITRRSNHFRVYVPSMKHGKPTPCESMLEAKFIRLIEVSPFRPSLRGSTFKGRDLDRRGNGNLHP